MEMIFVSFLLQTSFNERNIITAVSAEAFLLRTETRGPGCSHIQLVTEY